MIVLIEFVWKKISVSMYIFQFFDTRVITSFLNINSGGDDWCFSTHIL